MNIFIAYDFEIGGTLPANLEGVCAKPPQGHVIDWPGAPDGINQGSIWKTKVEPGIRACDRLLAFVDLPNANVGFEIGYGLGLGKGVALACCRKSVPPWLTERPPLNGFLCQWLTRPDAIRAAVQAETWIRLTDSPTPGPGVLVLCPAETGAVYLEQLPGDWGWRILPESGWDLHKLPGHLDGVGLVVWVIAPHDEGPPGRDGSENAALAVIAGYAEARPDLELRVFQAANTRPVADVSGVARKFASVREWGAQLESLKQEWEARRTPPVGSDPAAGIPERPPIEPLPVDDWSAIPARFLGRQLYLHDAADAVEGLLHRARTGQEPPGGRAVQVIWVHGFGGMGKSWFLHRARLQAGAAARAVVVDWDSTVWRYPLTGEPRCPADLFETLAYRLAQVYGPDAADAYWRAGERVRSQGGQHRRLLDQFEGQLFPAAGTERVGTTMLHLLEREGLWSDDPAKRTRKLDAWRRDGDRYHQTFLAWCHETARDADPAAVEPDRVLVDGLREALRQAARRHPLLLLLDTGEVLSADLDRWLRRLLVPLCREEAPLLILIGSRLAPDVALPAGSREGWLAELPGGRFRPIPFGELVRFSVEEIGAALAALTRPLAGDREEVAGQLHKITYGVPLAVRALLDLHEDGAGDSLLSELAADEEPLDEGEAVRRVVGTVARRLLYHLAQERKPEREDDLRDIIALALLQRADGAILQQLWPGRRVRDRLRDLDARYALLSGGDLHATVRAYLRRYWRDEAERPALWDEVLEAVEKAVATLPPLERDAVTPELLARRTMALNVQTWRRADQTVPELARLLAVVLAHQEDPDDVVALLRELPLTGKPLEAARKLWKKTEVTPDNDQVIAWLRALSDGSEPWTDLERASLALCEGLAFSPWGMKPQEALPVFVLLKSAFDYFGVERLPQRHQVGEAFLALAGVFDPYWSEVDHWLAQTETAYLCALQLETREAVCFNNLGWLYAGQGRPAEAEQAYRRACELDPNYAIAWYNLGYLYAEKLGRPAEAEQAFRRACELDPKSAYPHNGLGNLYADQGRPAEAEQAYRRACELDPRNAGGLRGLAWLYLLHHADLDQAQHYVQQAMTLEPEDFRTRFTQIAVTTWTTGWETALQAMVPEWLQKVPAWYVGGNRSRLLALFRKVREQGGLASLAARLQAVADHPPWQPWSEAVTALATGTGPQACTTAEAQRLYEELA